MSRLSASRQRVRAETRMSSEYQAGLDGLIQLLPTADPNEVAREYNTLELDCNESSSIQTLERSLTRNYHMTLRAKCLDLESCREMDCPPSSPLPSPSRTARIMVFGDMHFSARSLTILDLMCERCLQRLDEQKPDHAVFLGDTHDRFGLVPTPMSKRVIRFFYQVSLRCPFTLLIGNHDIPNKTLFYCEDHDFHGMKYYWKNTQVIDKCERFSVNGLLFAGVAYCPNGRLLEGLEPAQPIEELAGIFCHQEIRGCSINGIPSAEGDKWDRSWTPIFCGHIHLHHTPQRNVHYIGSPYQDSFGEDPDKSISLLTFTEIQTEAGSDARVTGATWKEERIYLGLPKKFRLHMLANEFWSWEPESPHLYSLTVAGTPKECQIIRESKMYKQMMTGGNKIELLNVMPETEEMDGPAERGEFKGERRTLREIVSDSIVGKPHLQEIHNLVWSGF